MWLKEKLQELADEAIETAKELRDIHRDDMGREDEEPKPQQIPLPLNPPPASKHGAASNTSDVAARLAALKEKLQTKKPGTSAAPLPIRQPKLTAVPTLATSSAAPQASVAPQPPLPAAVVGSQDVKHQSEAMNTTAAENTPQHITREAAAEQHRQHDQVVHELQGQLQSEQLAYARLEAEMEAMKHHLESSLTERDQDRAELELKLASKESECATLRESLGDAQQQAAIVSNGTPPAESDALHARVSALEAELSASNADRGALRQQLHRLKTQMLLEQEDEEEKVRWRVDAEVKLALEKAGRDAAGNVDATTSSLQAQLNSERQRADRFESESVRWENEASSREAELANLQRALGELSYESEVAERLRPAIRAGEAEIQQLRSQLKDARNATSIAQSEKDTLAEQLASLHEEVAKIKEKEGERDKEVLRLHVALQEAQRKVDEVRGLGGPIPRPTVLQALAVVMQNRQAALEQVVALLDLTEEEQQQLPQVSQQPGDGNSLADAWLTFLAEQVDHEVNGVADIKVQPTGEAEKPPKI